jgi:BRO family, N-terminal domain
MSSLSVFEFESKQVRFVGTEDYPEWIAQDVCDVLENGQAWNILRDYDEDEKGLYSIQTLGGEQQMLTVTEPGLYRLIFKSRKPVAKRFQRWVLHEVLPSIRKTGKYEIPQPQNIRPLPPTDIRLVNFVSALSVIGIDTTNPRINQAVQDLVSNQIFGIQPQLSAQTDRWQGVVEIAESIGYGYIARDLSLRSQLGKFVSRCAETHHLIRKQERRLCNGTMRDIWLYLVTEQLKNLIETWCRNCG